MMHKPTLNTTTSTSLDTTVRNAQTPKDSSALRQNWYMIVGMAGALCAMQYTSQKPNQNNSQLPYLEAKPIPAQIQTQEPNVYQLFATQWPLTEYAQLQPKKNSHAPYHQ
jgi:hypothetical protein